MKKILYILFILAPFLSSAQQIVFEQEQYPFPVTFYGVESQLGFMVADAYYHHDFGDIDGDGDYDILLAGGFGREHFIENIGTSDSAIFKYITNQYVVPFSDYMFQSPAFCDIDNDNDLDLFIGVIDGYLTLFENIGAPDSAIYILADSNYADIDTPEKPIPDFIDIDSDGDYDLFIGIGQSSSQGQIIYYRNDGTPELSNMIFITDTFSDVDVNDDSSPEFCDIDNDDDYDLFVGCEDGTIWFYENIGTPDTFDFEYVTNNYNGIDVGNSSVPRFCDIDNDGDFDLFVANESAGNSVAFEGDISFYRNIGTEFEPIWEFITSNYLFMDMSLCSSPNVIDIDDNGSLEILVGILGGELVLFENEGTSNDPSYYFADSAFLDLNLTYQPTLSFGDLDGDDDLDFAVSRLGFTDYIDTYKNIGTSSEPEYEFWENITSDSDWGLYGVALCDIEGDEDLDLFIGDGFNQVQFWENIGNELIPRFVLSDTNYFDTQTIFWRSLYPFFVDIDHDNDYDCVMGSEYGTGSLNYIFFYRNIGDIYNSNFVLEDTLLITNGDSLHYLRPSLADIDGDGDDDMFVGEVGGAMLFFRNMEYNTVNRERRTENRNFTLMPNYPNPFNASTAISYQLLAVSDVNLTVYDMLGREVAKLVDGFRNAGKHQVEFDAKDLTSGIYFARLDAGNYHQVQKLLLLK